MRMKHETRSCTQQQPKNAEMDTTLNEQQRTVTALAASVTLHHQRKHKEQTVTVLATTVTLHGSQTNKKQSDFTPPSAQTQRADCNCSGDNCDVTPTWEGVEISPGPFFSAQPGKNWLEPARPGFPKKRLKNRILADFS